MIAANGFTYKGYTYVPWDDCDDDCVKIWHDFRSESGTTVTCDWSPYERMTEADIKLWIDLDMPGRIHQFPLNHEDLLEIRCEQRQIIQDITNAGIE